METVPGKGWVRDGVLSLLARRPSTVSELARELGVSKATVSYHVKSLVRRNLVEISDVRSVRGGVYSKTLSLNTDKIVLARRLGEKETAMDKLDEEYERMLLRLQLAPEMRPADDFKIFLYHAFRLMSFTGFLEKDIFREFGTRAGEQILAPSLKFISPKKGLKELTLSLGASEIAAMSTEDELGGGARLTCSGCLGSTEHGSLVCAFTEGLLSGILQAKRGKRYTVRRLDEGSASSKAECLFSVRLRKGEIVS